MGELCLAVSPWFQPDLLRHAHEKTPFSTSIASSPIALLSSPCCDQGTSMSLSSSIRDYWRLAIASSPSAHRFTCVMNEDPSGLNLFMVLKLRRCLKWPHLSFPDLRLCVSENSRPARKTKAQNALPATQFTRKDSLSMGWSSLTILLKIYIIFIVASERSGETITLTALVWPQRLCRPVYHLAELPHFGHIFLHMLFSTSWKKENVTDYN